MNGNKPFLPVPPLLRNLWTFGFVGNPEDGRFSLHAFHFSCLSRTKIKTLGFTVKVPNFEFFLFYVSAVQR